MTSRDSLCPFVSDPDFVLYVGDVRDILSKLSRGSLDCCVTSPPYWGLRDYGMDGQLGLERTPDEYVAAMVAVFAEVREVLKPEGTLWLNLGDSYNAYNGGAGPGSKLSKTQTEQRPKLESGFGLRSKDMKPKDLVGIPWRVALALQADGWYLRSDIIWSKPNPMPESITDRPTKSHEYVFLLSASQRYFYDAEAIREPAEWARWGDQTNPKHEGSESAASWIGPKTKRKLQGENDHRNARSVWEIPTRPYPEAHFAVFPEELPRRCIAAGCPEGGWVLDPFMGSGTTALAARGLGRKAVGIELNPGYAELCARRLAQQSLLAEASYKG